MTFPENYRAVRNEVGNDVLKTLAFVFIGIPIALAIIVYVFVL